VDGAARGRPAALTGGRDPTLVRALTRWQHAAGLYWPYVCTAPFLGRVPRRRTPGAGRVGAALAAAIEQATAQEGTALFVDLPPTKTLRWRRG
jgi:hypothetical protein